MLKNTEVIFFLNLYTPGEDDGYVFSRDCVDVFSYTANSPAILRLPIK